MKDLSDVLVRPGQKGVERLVMDSCLDLLPKGRMTHPLHEIRALDDALHEERQLRADAQHQALWEVAAQLLDCCSGFHKVVECLLLAFVPHLWRKPYFEPLFEGILGRRHEAVDSKAAYPNRIAVQIIF